MTRWNELFAEMEEVALRDRIPIMERDGLEGMLQFLRIQQPKRILEIGTAIGYSALQMKSVCPSAEIVTVERDEIRFQQACRYVDRAGCQKTMHLLLGDALDVHEEVASYGSFDALFIDAAKGHYEAFFQLYAPSLRPEGVIYIDNVLFRGYVFEGEAPTKRMQQLAKKMRRFHEWMEEQVDYTAVTYPVGDGVMVVVRNHESGGHKE
ncbi:O-methyltransferase [Bacillus fonticola]|uniref:O-methyltransferase n=1 Tax=Bacillus fonticola TaxID=2728853 RepID=UPI001D1572B7|nr:O-methyltransferase [Bacillus fonticola]